MVLAAKDGAPVLDAGYGMAVREEGIANTPQTKFCVASIGKLFTAVAIAQLAQQRKLSFGDTIGKFLTGFAPFDLSPRTAICSLQARHRRP